MYSNKYKKVEVLPKTKEDYISISIGNENRKLVFLDNYRFLSASLDNVSKGLKDEDFKIMKTYFTEEQFETLKFKDGKTRSFKGFFPYEYFDLMERLDETELPSFEKNWYSTLTGEDITKEQQNHVIKTWNNFNCKTFKDYHDLYLKMDVLILAVAMETFRKFFLEHDQIDPAYCFSAPGLTWQCGLKYTKVKLELLTDKDMLLMFEAQKRGGFSGVLGIRYIKAFNKYTSNYHGNGNRILDDNEFKKCLEKVKKGENLNGFLKDNFLLYLDANNLYGWAMSQKLPTGDFKWEDNPDYYKNIPKG